MNDIFETFKPNSALIAQYVDYYYLDVKPQNTKNEFKCFPHYKNTISLYISHINPQKGRVIYDPIAKPLQIFTPIIDSIYQVEQLGMVHRIVIVFKPLGIYQFFKNIPFTDFIIDYPFFKSLELSQLFATLNQNAIIKLLDQFLLDRYVEYKNDSLSQALHLILSDSDTYSVEELSKKVKLSRRHLNRLFNTHFGISIKKFNEIVHFRRTVERKILENSQQSFTSLAYDFNYCDQSHLIKIYKKLTESAPTAFFKKGTLLGNQDTFWHLKK